MREEKTKSTLACAQAQSDCSFYKERLEVMRSTNDALSKEVGDLRSRTSFLQVPFPTLKPLILNPQPSTLNPKPSTLNPQP
jgi:hypothetical protein